MKLHTKKEQKSVFCKKGTGGGKKKRGALISFMVCFLYFIKIS